MMHALILTPLGIAWTVAYFWHARKCMRDAQAREAAKH